MRFNGLLQLEGFSCQLKLMSTSVLSAEGGPNPDMNLNLAQVLEQCRNKNMPKAAVEAAIRSAVGRRPTDTHANERTTERQVLLDVDLLAGWRPLLQNTNPSFVSYLSMETVQ